MQARRMYLQRTWETRKWNRMKVYRDEWWFLIQKKKKYIKTGHDFLAFIALLWKEMKLFINIEKNRL